ncbi:putative multiple sugar transport system ATP-binding protein [Gracilibacillus halotolerans]|uniref:Putative multiple sugar transport system ATP-binding protein n=1 Tax=Gracilibacillus halotolerans TaxID=74386 RepID=A0A841RRH2_9BACI|nr:multiple monosaccharide ABC transporter ATP-binding protein [Gracilibacillus halotolerans]MBB6513815.1 putative multiple sugar transport system ATP-binding protein [Gracilibacillus halotolerans]
MSENYILEMQNITKEFPGVKALDHVNFKVKKGDIHSLVGENGAGKSTLMKVLSGVYPYGTYDGQILFNGKVSEFKDIKQSEELGIVIIHQELALSPYLSIAENIFLGNERQSKNIIKWRQTYQEAEKLLKRVGLTDSPETIVSEIGVGKQQLVEIAKALSKDVKLLILDEPTAALNENDSENLLNLLLELKKQGISSILISHKLNEVTQVSDSITILRDGQTIETLNTSETEISEDRIIKGMVGRELTSRFPDRNPKIGDIVFEVKNWNVYHPQQSDRKMIDNASLFVRKGEIVGIAGLMGAGRTELAMSIFGKSYGKKITGELWKDGQRVEFNTVSDAIQAGVVYATEDRKTYGLNLIDDVKHNITLANLKRITSRNVISKNKEITAADKSRKEFNIKTPSIDQLVGNLSGGNQQKVVLSKWIFTDPDVLILDEPTRGIDVGAKFEIYTQINKLAEQGLAVIVISSELPEVIGLSDRIYTMSEGKITQEVTKENATQETLMKYMTAKGMGENANNL